MRISLHFGACWRGPSEAERWIWRHSRFMRHSTLIVATVFTALTVFAAAPSKPLPEPIVIKLADIYTEFVHIRPLDDSNGAHLTFLFARKSKRAVDAISLKTGAATSPPKWPRETSYSTTRITTRGSSAGRNPTKDATKRL